MKPFARSLSVVCLLTFFAISPSLKSQEQTLDNFAEDITQQIKKAEKKHFFPKVLVVDFPSRPGGIKTLGVKFADALSDALASKLGASAVVDRKTLRGYLQANGISPFDLADREIAIWIADEVGANAIVFGSVTPSERELSLVAELFRIGDSKKLGNFKASLSLNDELLEIVAKPLDWPTHPGVVVSCVSGSREEVQSAFEAAGATMPTCIYCPNPSYTDAARAAKFQGDLKFEVIVNEQGRAQRISIVKGDRNGLTAKAIEAIKGWKFKPAMKNGQPVTVCVLIEVVFRLL